MFKQIIVIIILSVAIVFGMSYAQQALQYLIDGHDWIDQLLTNVFSSGQAGNLLRGSIALLSIPLIAGLVPALIYWIAKRRWFPYFMQIVWILWLLEVGALVMIYKASSITSLMS